MVGDRNGSYSAISVGYSQSWTVKVKGWGREKDEVDGMVGTRERSGDVRSVSK